MEAKLTRKQLEDKLKKKQYLFTGDYEAPHTDFNLPLQTGTDFIATLKAIKKDLESVYGLGDYPLKNKVWLTAHRYGAHEGFVGIASAYGDIAMCLYANDIEPEKVAMYRVEKNLRFYEEKIARAKKESPLGYYVRQIFTPEEVVYLLSQIRKLRKKVNEISEISELSSPVDDLVGTE